MSPRPQTSLSIARPDYSCKTGDIGSAERRPFDRHALLSGVYIARNVVLASVSGIVERAAKGVYIIRDCASPREGCCRDTMVTEIIRRGHAGHTIPLDVPIPATMRGDFQRRLLETLNPCNSLRRTELFAVRRNQQSPGSFVPGILSDENPHHRRILCRTSSQEVDLYEMAFAILPRHWRRHRANTNERH